MQQRRRHPAITVRRLAVGGRQIRVSTLHGAGQHAFVLVPGIGMSATYFERLAPVLSEAGTVHAVDLPGFAGLPRPHRRISIAEYADLLGAALDDLNLPNPVLIGHSMGTQVVTDLAARRPGVTHLVLIGPVINPAERRLTLQTWRFAQCSVREPARVMLIMTAAFLLCGVQWFFRVMPAMLGYRVEERLPEVQANTLIIRGEHDFTCPRDWVIEMARLLPRARAFEIAGAAHSVMYNHADDVARLCLDHARQAEVSDEDRIQQVIAETDRAEVVSAEPALALIGRVTEIRGILTDDERLIEQGKILQARATRRVAPSSDPKESAHRGKLA